MPRSKKQVSDIVSGAGLLTSIATKLDAVVRERGGSDADIHRLSTPEGDAIFAQWADILVGARGDTYPLTVNFGRSIADMVAAGGYIYANRNILDRNFPIVGSGTVEAEAVLVHLDRVATDAKVLAEIDRLGLRPGILPELLALGVTYPHLQRQFPVVALGSVCIDRLASRYVVGLWDSPDGRKLGLSWLGNRWDPCCRFLAFRK